MLAKITLYDGTIYKIADKTTDTEDGIYLGRIKDELSLVSAMQEAGNAPATINLTIINDDDFIPHSKDLWAADVMLTNDNGVSWRGKINFCNFDADGNLYVTASEKTAPELELQLPDEVRQVYTIDEDFHQSSVTMTIPLVIGGTHEKPILVPTILIDKTQGIYLICVGEIREVVAVYSGAEKLPLSEYMPWRGTAEQPYHKGFAYVAIASGKRLNADGSYAEINVEVVGLKLGDFTEEECRNGALFLYYFLTTAATGINGWGCGIDQSEIDTASFQSAITLCNQLGYKLDGIMWLRQSAQSWIDQICQAIHGKYSINANGKRSLFIDYAGNASKKTFTASNMQVDKYGKNSYTSVVYNKGILSYDYNPITGLFMQSAQYENAESIAQIGEQKFVGESYLIKDPTTALAVLEYTCKRSQTAAEAIEFKTDDIDTLLRAGDVITINRPDLSINNALYQIQNISITDYEASISAVKFDTSVFIVSGTPSSVNWGSEKAITPALTPAQATNLLLSTGFDINPDGTGTPFISGTFTVPEGGWLAAAVQYGIGTNPNNWTELALITEGKFKISPVNVGTIYSIRVRMITSTGHSDYITGQITATGDTTPPAEPTIAVNATDKTVTVQCGLDNPPYDMGGFQIYRKKSTEADSAYTLIAMVAANRGYASYSDYVSEYITYNYKAKSYDRSGNLSTNFSNTASVTVTGIQANDVAATALAMPTGSILRLSAKNCTTASIAEDKGVKDCSGWGHHGRAYGGVIVLNGGEGFAFDGASAGGRLRMPDNMFTEGKAYTMWCAFKLTSMPTISFEPLIAWTYSKPNIQLWHTSDYKIKISGDNGFTQFVSDFVLETNRVYKVAISVDYEHGTRTIYVDGVAVNTTTKTGAVLTPSVTYHGLGGHFWGYNDNNFTGEISEYRIYPRALSASEVKTLYMFPDDVTFGQMTADLIGANVIKAQNLVLTENIITTNAQIKQAVIDNMTITGNANFIAEQQARAQVQTNLNTVTTNIYSPNTTTINGGKITTGTIQAAAIAANTITANKLNVEALKRPNGAKIILSAKGITTNSSKNSGGVPDISGNARTARNYNGYVAITEDSDLGWCFSFTNNNNGRCIYCDDSTFNPFSGSWTIFAKIKVGSLSPSSYQVICDKGSSTTTNGPIFLNWSSTGFFFRVNTSGGTDVIGGANAKPSSTSTVVNLACSYNPTSGQMRMWFNGVNVYSKIHTYKGEPKTNNNTLVWGREGGGTQYPFVGKMACMSVFDHELSESEVKALSIIGTDTESGQITADRIATDAIKSRNYAYSSGLYSTAGTFLDLANGQIISKNFSIDSSGNATFKGALSGATGSFTGAVTASSGSFNNLKINQTKSLTLGLWATKNYLCSLYNQNQTINSIGLVLSSTAIDTDFAGAALVCLEQSSSSKMTYPTQKSGALFQSEFGTALYVHNKNGIGIHVQNRQENGYYDANHCGISVASDNAAYYSIYNSLGKCISVSGWSSSCDESIKKDIKDVSTLEKLKGIRVKKFKYSQKAIQEKLWQKDQTLKREGNLKKGIKTEEEKMPEFKDDENAPDYIMAMAGEFNKAFGVDNGNEESINYTNAIGVALRAIQELAEISDAQKAEIAELKALLKNSKDNDSEKELIEPSFDELLKNGENQQKEQKQ